MEYQTNAVDLMLIEQRVTNDGPSVGVAYLLCIFLGWISVHRFYLGRPKSAFLQIASWLVVIQPIWWFVDLFLIPGMVRAKQNEIRTKLQENLRIARTADAISSADLTATLS